MSPNHGQVEAWNVGGVRALDALCIQRRADGHDTQEDIVGMHR